MLSFWRGQGGGLDGGKGGWRWIHKFFRKSRILDIVNSTIAHGPPSLGSRLVSIEIYFSHREPGTTCADWYTATTMWHALIRPVAQKGTRSDVELASGLGPVLKIQLLIEILPVILGAPFFRVR
jgi:hypothetical protein